MFCMNIPRQFIYTCPLYTNVQDDHYVVYMKFNGRQPLGCNIETQRNTDPQIFTNKPQTPTTHITYDELTTFLEEQMTWQYHHKHER